MNAAIVLRALTEGDRAALARYAATLGVSPDAWPHVPALREFVEQLAVANTVAYIVANPTSIPASERKHWIRAAQLLGLSPEAVLKRRARARVADQVASDGRGGCPTESESVAPRSE